MEKRLDEAYSHLKKASEKPKKDKCSLFCELLEKKLGELDENTQDFAMFEIDKFIYELKQRKYSFQCHKNQFTLPASSNQLIGFSTSNFHPQTHNTPSPALSQESNLYISPCTSSPALTDDTNMSPNPTYFQRDNNFIPQLSSSLHSLPILQSEGSTTNTNQEQLHLNAFEI